MATLGAVPSLNWDQCIVLSTYFTDGTASGRVSAGGSLPE